MFPHINLRDKTDPWGGDIFILRGINCTNLLEAIYIMLHIKYQGSGPSGIRQEDVFMVSLYKLGLFLPQDA